MTDAPLAPIEEQVAQVKAQNDAHMAEWQDDFTEEEITIPYKREDDKGGKKADDVDNVATETETEEEQQEQATELVETPVSVVTTEDPGEYVAKDYSFEVTLASGKTVKVGSPQEAEKIADDPDNFETAKQLMDFINKQNKMQRSLDRDYDKWEADKQKHEAQVAEQKQREQTVQQLTAGFEYLIAKGLMPKISPADAVANWRNPDIAKHPGVKEQIELINYMEKENATREKAGIPLLASALDAYNAWQLEKGRTAQEDERKAAGQARKAAGARISGVSASQQGAYVPKGIAVGRVMPMRGAAMWDD